MLQQQTSCEQTKAMDVTIQFNVAPNNVSRMTAMFSNEVYQPNNQTTAPYPVLNSYAPRSCMQATHPGAPSLPFTPVHGGVPYLNASGYVTDSPQMDQRNIRDNVGFNHPSVYNGFQNDSRYESAHNFMSDDFYYQSSPPALRTNSQFCMNRNGYESPSNHRMNQSTYYPLQDIYSTSSVPQMENNVQDWTNQQVKAPHVNVIKHVENVSDQPSPYSLPQCQYSATNATVKISRESLKQDSPCSHSSSSSDEQYEETNVAMREREVRYRLELLKSKNSKEVDDLETLQGTQTALIDHERHKMLTQMACSKSSTDYINAHYNRKLLDVLQTIEQKLSNLENAPKVEEKKATKRKSEGVRRGLPKKAKELLEGWYDTNLANPYPSSELSRDFATQGGVTLEQVRKWFANRRNRSKGNKEKMRESSDNGEEPTTPEEQVSSEEPSSSPEMQHLPEVLAPSEEPTQKLRL